uniref:Uncharacterized protein n=1 Tax=Oryzias latipes TaxID=8090 RepID=A0A3P9LKU4_ORYLA
CTESLLTQIRHYNTEPRRAPEPFDGSADDSRPFFSSYWLHFDFHPSDFVSKQSKVAFALSFLTSWGRCWGIIVLNNITIPVEPLSPALLIHALNCTFIHKVTALTVNATVTILNS